MTLYGFLQDRHWYEDLGHILIGHVPMLGWVREHLQWPPGNIITLEQGRWYAPLDRVEDSYRDFLGYAIGNAMLTAELAGVILWLVLR